ncbi:MAG: AAA family ATPase [bacterium]|nr:AAA family ATPase [bacterium]
MSYRTFFAFQREPFGQDLPVEDLYPLPGLQAATERLLYGLSLGAVSIVTGDVGSGKSTALRYGASKLHPSQYRVVPVVATTGSMADMMRQICMAFDVDGQSHSLARLTKTLRGAIIDIAHRKQTPVLIIDEASLMRLEIFAQLHTLSQFDMDSRPILPIVLAGQNNLVDKLMFHTSRPLASRIIGRSHLEGLKHKDMAGYIKHHLQVAGVKNQLFADEAILAIHQGSGGLLRRANHLAKGALMAAAAEKSQIVAAEHVRIASSELI